MNPPSALHGAMSRDRKPFTYTPGGLDLSEIKSERMAKRLMRNAMNQGVPEVPTHPVQSPPMPSTPVALPNFNCLPVQVFPTFNLPANPKSLLRTRSNPDPKESPIQRVFPPTFVNNVQNESETFNKNTPTYSQVNNNRPASMYEYTTGPANVNTLPRVNYGSDGYTAPTLPEISYDAEYFRVPPKAYNETISKSPIKLEISTEKEIVTDNGLETKIDITVDPNISPIADTKSSAPTTEVTKPLMENVGSDNEQSEAKIVKKQIVKESKIEERNGDQNGETNVEAEMTIKLPTKKSAAKTETSVEVVKNVLPDGTVQEVKTTTTKTTIDGKTEIKTKTETKTFPKEVDDDEEVVEEEEEEEEEENGEMTVQEVEDDQERVPEKSKKTVAAETTKDNGDDNIIKSEERSETNTTTTKKVTIVQESPKEEVEEEDVQEEEEVEDVEPVTVIIKNQEKIEETVPQEESKSVEIAKDEEEVAEEEKVEEVTETEVKRSPKEAEVEEDADDEEVEEEEEPEVKKEEIKVPPPKDDEEEEQEEEEEYEEAEEKGEDEVIETKEAEVNKVKLPQNEEKVAEDEVQSEKKEVEESKSTTKEVEKEEMVKKTEPEPEESKPELKQESLKPTPQPEQKFEQKIPIREPSIPLEKVEDVEIKPIGLGSGLITKSHTENTEIITSSIDPKGGLSTQTEYNKVENIVTVNRTTKILDHNYENIIQQGIPTVKTYIPPPSIDRISTSPLLTRPYQPVYPPEQTTERRHSLLLERLSVERQIPVDTYQYNSQTSEQQTQWQDDPRAEVLTVSNVKPSTITNQQWYQQSKPSNGVYNNVPSSTPTQQSWNQPKSQPQPQTQYQPQAQYQPPQNQYQPSPQNQYQPSPQPQMQYQPSPTPQYQTQPQQQYQPSYTETTDRTSTKTYSYTPKPTWVSNVEASPNLTQPSQYSYTKDTTDSYQKTTQQYSSSYVPPPWEQDSTYVENPTQNYYQPAPQTTYTPAATQSWKPPPAAKYSKPNPIAYIPPPPNKSFVVPVTNVEPPKMPGRKTYYSEYERRYITVPESTYVPSETKYQPQPDASPQYYYDNNEPTESVEPQWRKELREFTEKTNYTQTEQTNVKPPWEEDSKYAKTTPTPYTPTPTWSQTLRPRSWRERSFESEYVGSQEWPKTNTLGRGRPLSTFSKSVDSTIPERPRGVSVDRYNPNSYQSPSEHPPVQSHTLPTPAPHAGYHNPNVPAYHARASAEPREQPVSYRQPVWKEARASPIQSRSFKYLQWITGTDD